MSTAHKFNRRGGGENKSQRRSAKVGAATDVMVAFKAKSPQTVGQHLPVCQEPIDSGFFVFLSLACGGLSLSLLMRDSAAGHTPLRACQMINYITLHDSLTSRDV